MQTMRLFACQGPSRIEALLESLLQAREDFPRKARKGADGGELPSALQQLAVKLTDTDRVWSAWAGKLKVWQLRTSLKDGMWQQCAP